MQKRLGEAIRKHREDANLTQEKVADEIRMAVSYYSAIERGEKNLQLSTLMKVCNGLDVRMSVVFGDAEDMT